ncbi:MAG: hypothetical protein HKN13_10270 [Rhodothermales bacterium]|nr:hypothetical protein [Rhodothermales bacterium]
MKANLDDIVEALETGSDDFRSYVHKDTGKVVVIAEEYFGYAEEPETDDDQPEWMREIIAEARHILQHRKEYLDLPSSWDIHEYKIMENFCHEQEDDSIREQLLRATRGKVAFRRFKDQADDLEVIDDWYAYKEKALTQIAIGWSVEHKIAYTQS